MNQLTTDHYRLLLGLDDSWSVDSVELELAKKRVSIRISYVGGPLCCPECSKQGPQADLAPERTWRHLDTMQFATEIHARTPRIQCKSCGVKTVEVPWAGKHSRFTLLFEAFAIEVLKASSSIQAAATLLKLDWDAAQAIMDRAVARGLRRREVETVPHVGIDEKSFRRGHDYISVMSDIDGGRVLEVSEGRTKQSAGQLWKSLGKQASSKVKAVAMDMWQPFMQSAAEHAPQASIVHDKFHCAKELGEAVDQVRRQENRQLSESGDRRLNGTRQLWLYAKENLSEAQLAEIAKLREEDLRTSLAWAIKENFRRFWDYRYRASAEGYFENWYDWVIDSKLAPMTKAAQKLQRHLRGILGYISHRITNAASEGFNSRIQALKAAARGFRRFANYRTRILFFCGRLDLMPDGISH